MGWVHPIFLELKTRSEEYSIAQIQALTVDQIINYIGYPGLARRRGFVQKLKDAIIAARRHDAIVAKQNQIKTFLINGRQDQILAAYPDIEWEFGLDREKPFLKIYFEGKPTVAEVVI